MIYLKTDEEIEMLRKANQVVAGTLAEVAKWVAPGVTTRRLDQIAEEYIRSQGCTPGFKGLYGFPATLCTSVNEVVVHGIPSNYVLEDGDIVSCDCGAVTPEGFNGDSTYTFCVGEVSEEVLELLRVTKESLYIGIEHAVPGGAQLRSPWYRTALAQRHDHCHRTHDQHGQQEHHHRARRVDYPNA